MSVVLLLYLFCVLVFVAGAVPAFAMLNVDLDFVSYERDFFCPDCEPRNGVYSVNVFGKDNEAGSFDMVVITLLLENNRNEPPLYLDNLVLFLNYYIGDDTFTQYLYSSIRHHYCSGSSMCSTSDYELHLPDKCENNGLDDSIPTGSSREVTLCFPVPAGVTDYKSFGVRAYDGRQFILLDGRACEDLTKSKSQRNCGGTWDLTRQIMNDGVYEYTIADASIYNNVYSGYDQVVNDSVMNALDLWSGANPHIRFELVDNKTDADFNVLFGGTGEAIYRIFGGVVDTYGSVNDIGCLVEHDIDCNLTLFVENRNRDGTVELLSPQMLEYVTAHEVGHLLGLPHHPSALQSMHSPLDAVVDWYDDGEYGFVTPSFTMPAIQTMAADGRYGELRAAYDVLFESLNGRASESEIELSRIIIELFELLG